MKVLIAIALTVSCAAAISDAILLPPADVWISELSEVPTVLKCQSKEQPLTSCLWFEPNSERMHNVNSAKYKKGNVRSHGATADDDMACAIELTSVTDDNLGAWKCVVSVVNATTDETMSASRMLSLHKSVSPESVGLASPFDVREITVDDDDVSQRIKCVVRNAMPKPEIQWFYNDQDVSAYAESDVTVESANDAGDHDWSQTFMYSPQTWDDDGQLRCVVKHVALASTQEAGIYVRLLRQKQKLSADIGHSKTVSRHRVRRPHASEESLVTAGVAIIVILIAMIVLVIFSISKWTIRRHRANRASVTDIIACNDATLPSVKLAAGILETDLESGDHLNMSGGDDGASAVKKERRGHDMFGVKRGFSAFTGRLAHAYDSSLVALKRVSDAAKAPDTAKESGNDAVAKEDGQKNEAAGDAPEELGASGEDAAKDETAGASVPKRNVIWTLFMRKPSASSDSAAKDGDDVSDDAGAAVAKADDDDAVAPEKVDAEQRVTKEQDNDDDNNKVATDDKQAHE